MNSPSRPRTRGFTLIELLVVIAIIAILAAILFPVFAKARENAKKANCLSNLKRVGTAAFMWVNDNDDMMMPIRRQSTGEDILRYWFAGVRNNEWRDDWGLLHPYMGTKQLHDCPSAGNIKAVNANFPFYPAYGLYYPGQMPISRAKNAANTVWICDAAAINGTNGQLIRIEGINPPSNKSPSLHGRHNGRANVLWMDGHAAAFKPVFRSDISGVRSEVNQRRFNLGELAPGAITGNDSTDNYYFLLDK